MIDEDDKVILKEILSYRQVNKEQVFIMQTFMVKYIDPKVKICGHCSSQIRFAFKRLTKWVEKHRNELDL